MPTYDYRCPKCGHTVERFHSISKVLEEKCPSCGGANLDKLISGGGGILFRGSGFYHTDYKMKKPNKPTESAGSDS